jgi:hypothetical protein
MSADTPKPESDAPLAAKTDAAEPAAAGSPAGAQAHVSWWRRIVGRGGRQASPLRRWSVAALVVLACIGLLVSVLALWLHTVIFNTDQYVKTIAPIGKDPAVTQAVADKVTASVIEATDLQDRLANRLPSQVSFLAPALTTDVQGFLNKKVNELLQTPQAYDAWLKINTVVHQQVVDILRNRSNRVFTTSDSVQLNLLPLVGRALTLVDQILPDFITSRVTIPQIDPNAPYDEQVASLSTALGRPLPAGFGTIQIASGEQLRKAQTLVKVFDALVIALWIITALLIAAALVLSPWRLRTLIELGLGTLIAVMLSRAATHWIENKIVSGASKLGGGDVSKSMIVSVVKSLGHFTIWLLISAVIVTVVAFLAGRPQWFQAAGRGVARAADRGAAAADAHLPAAQRVAATYVDYLLGGGVVVALIVLFFVSSSITAVIVTLVVLILYELGVWWLARRRTTETAAA